MSAPNQGRQSPEPERSAHSQVGKTADGQAGAAPSETHAQEKSEEAKDSVLSSNPEPTLGKAADAKISKEGRGPGV
ncbi:MAG: hypothetical protein MMC23_000027 [Stictis urceolatum]|nr:hypothetical protein [Stictis urceolata]